MKLVKIVDGKPIPYSYSQFRDDNRSTVYGKAISNSKLNSQNVYTVRTAIRPSEIGKKAVLNSLPTEVNGEWVLDWSLYPLTADEARSLRNNLLVETDWIVIKSYERGQNIPAEWELYRQALRDITSQAGFPYSVEWPTKP